MNKISFYFILFFSISLFADEDQTINLIVENCKSCHNLNIETTKKIPSINNLEKDEFVRLMKKYKNDKDNSVMNRISRVLTNKDILKMADKIYGKNKFSRRKFLSNIAGNLAIFFSCQYLFIKKIKCQNKTKNCYCWFRYRRGNLPSIFE